MPISGNLNDTFQGSLSSGGSATYDVSAPAGGILHLQFVHPNGVGTTGEPLEIDVYDAAGNLITSHTVQGSTAFDTTIPGAGTYAIRVADSNQYDQHDTGNYAITPSLSTTPGTVYDGPTNNASTTAQAVASGGAIVGDLGLGDTDVYKLSAASGGELDLQFAHPNGLEGGQPITLSVLDAGGNVVTSQSLTGDATLRTTVATAGDYYIGDADGAFYMSGDHGIYGLTPTLSATPGQVYDGAANNTAPTAETMTLGQTIVGGLSQNDADYFKFSAASAGVLNLAFAHPDGYGTTGDPISVAVYDAAGNVVTSETLGGSAQLVTTVAAAGDYYIKIGAGYEYATQDSGLYHLTPTMTSSAGTIYDGAANNTTSSAESCALGTPVVGSLDSGDVDVFQFQATAAGMLDLNFTHPNGYGSNGAPIQIDVLDGSGNSILSQLVQGSGQYSAQMPGAGTYYIKVADGEAYGTAAGGLYTLLPTLGNGSPGATLTGTPGADVFTSTPGNDTINGGAGVDTVDYHGPRANYMVNATFGTGSVVDDGGKDGVDQLTDIERLHFSDRTIAFDTDGSAGQAYRLYQAAFDRTPDAAGLGYWVGALDHGATLHEVAAGFIASAEYQTVYGSAPGATDLVTRYYQNILHRAPDAAGLDFWVHALNDGASDTASVLAAISESGENAAALIGTISHGMEYLNYG